MNAAVLNQAWRIVDDAWAEAQRSPFVQRQLGTPPLQLPEISMSEAQRRAAVGRGLLERLSRLDSHALPDDLALTLRVVRFRAETWSKEAEWYWKAVDPLGIGMFGLFLPTAYCGGWLLSALHAQLSSFEFKNAHDTEQYLALVADYARLIHAFADRTAGQAERGARMPKVQVQQARTLLARLKSGARQALGVAPERLAGLRADAFTAEVERRIETRVEVAFDRALDGVSDAYLAKAPVTVGLSQYAGGPELYGELVKLHTTLDLTPEEVHARGHERIAQIESQMKVIREQLGFQGDHGAFLASLDQDARWRADTVEGVKAVFQRYIDRMETRYHECFSWRPPAAYGVAPMPQALESSMTYGYYDPPRLGHPEGCFRFNAVNLTRQALVSLGSLTYHELVPGHHLHFSTQQQSESMHPFLRYSFVNAFNEGWAEYAATLAGEIGLYEVPEERYGRLLNDAFLTCRLVVDTGMNALGWSLEQGQAYMRAHSGMSEAEIKTDSIRYSCDIPAQALAYKLGDAKILELRARMQRACGAKFNLKDFHAAVLRYGALPMPELEWHLEREVAGLTARGLS